MKCPRDEPWCITWCRLAFSHEATNHCAATLSRGHRSSSLVEGVWPAKRDRDWIRTVAPKIFWGEGRGPWGSGDASKNTFETWGGPNPLLTGMTYIILFFSGRRGHGGTLTKYPRKVESPRPAIRGPAITQKILQDFARFWGPLHPLFQFLGPGELPLDQL